MGVVDPRVHLASPSVGASKATSALCTRARQVAVAAERPNAELERMAERVEELGHRRGTTLPTN